MSQISRRLFFVLLGALIPGVFGESSEAATAKKPTPTPTPKKPTPTPTPKKPTPTPTPKKSTPTPTTKKQTTSPTPSNSSKTSPSSRTTQGNISEGIVIAQSSDLVLRQTKIFYVKDAFGISTGYSLTRTTRGVVAFDTSCTHAGAPTSLNGLRLECPAHGSIFDPESGQVLRGPAITPLRSYRTIESNGEIRIIIS